MTTPDQPFAGDPLTVTATGDATRRRAGRTAPRLPMAAGSVWARFAADGAAARAQA